MNAIAQNRVLIAGAGFSGALLAIHVSRLGIPVTLFERDLPGLAKGLAYHLAKPEHLLNVRAANMSAFADVPDDFVRWLGETAAPAAHHFMPRPVYGQYLRHLLDTACTASADLLHIHPGEVCDLDEDDHGATVTLADGTGVRGYAAVLALGHFPPRLPEIFGGLTAPLAWHDPWQPAALEGLAREAPVLLVGTGLTAVDLIASLDRAGHCGPIMALSRHGLLPRAHLDIGPERKPVPLPQARGSQLLRAIRARAAAVGWHLAIDELRPHTQTLWRLHGDAGQKRFLRHARSYWDVHRHRMAPQIAARIADLQRSGRLSIVAGRIVAAERVGSMAQIAWRPRGKDQTASFDAARIINCIGPESDIARIHEPLLQALLARGTVRPDTHRLGLDVDAHWRILNRDGTPSQRIYAVGPLTKGVAWEIIAVPDIRVQLRDVAGHLAQLAAH